MRKKFFIIMFIIVLPILFIYVFFYYPQKKEYYQDVNCLKIACEKNRIIQELFLLIPQNAEEITISYRTNRIKNLNIAFKVPYIDWNSYISDIKDKLKNYSISALPQGKTDKIVYFFGTPDTFFKQIDITLNSNYIAIQSF